MRSKIYLGSRAFSKSNVVVVVGLADIVAGAVLALNGSRDRESKRNDSKDKSSLHGESVFARLAAGTIPDREEEEEEEKVRKDKERQREREGNVGRDTDNSEQSFKVLNGL